MSIHHGFASLFMLFNFLFFSESVWSQSEHPHPVIFELEFISNAELIKTAQFLRAQGIAATVKDEPKEMIEIEAESYTKAMDKLSHIVPNLPDISKFIWRNGTMETTLYETKEADISIKKEELNPDQKALKDYNDHARMSIVLKDDKKSVIKYESVVKKIEGLGYKITFAEGYLDAGWTELPAIDVMIPNNIISFKDAILQLSEIPEVARFMYNRGPNPHINEYIITFKNDTDLDLQIERFLANGIEVYKLDRLLNRVFIHFPQTEERNKIKLDQIKMLDDVVIIKNINENQQQFKNSEYVKNVKNILLDIPADVLRGKWRDSEYTKQLTQIAKNEVVKLQAKGMVVVNYGVYHEEGEVQIPEVVFTHSDKDSPKAEEILKIYAKSPYPDSRLKGSKSGGRDSTVMMCVGLFS
jgi:hypothetical protein